MRYEPIQNDDLGACAKVFVKVFCNPPWNEDWSIREAQFRLTEIYNTPGFVGIKVFNEDAIIGFAMGYVETFDVGRDYYLKEMCIKADIQRKGVGTILIEKLKKRLNSLGVRKIYLLTSRDGIASEFYKKNGFYINEKMIMMGSRL